VLITSSEALLLLIVVLAVSGLIIFVLLIILGISVWVAHELTQAKRVPVYGHPTELDLDYEDVTFHSRKDKIPLKGWYICAPSDSRCIILIQGQEHHRNSPGIRALQLAGDLVKQDYSALLFDFRGRGESGGKRDSTGDREQWDAMGAIDYVVGRGIPLERIGLLGFSLGAAVALLVAAKLPRIAAVVADSAWLDSYADLKQVPIGPFYLPAWFALPIALVGRIFFGADFSKVRPIKVVSKISRPIFFIHGQQDPVISFQETQELYKASGNPEDRVWIVANTGHVASYRGQPEEYAAKVASFFRRHIGE
jgi:pimeloyl-ACP methyl ester carboxylesterase